MLRREASNWLARLEGGSNGQVEQDFQRWYHADSAHAEAFDRVRQSYASAGLLRHSELARDCSPSSARPRISSPQPRWALAAGIAVALLVPGAILVSQGGFSPVQARNTVLLATAVGEIRQVALDDGSKVTLDTATKVEVELGRSERRAIVREGRARFEIASDPRPFIVTTASAIVTSGPAVMDVERLPDGARVEVLSGSATASIGSADQNGSPVTVSAGQGFTSGQQPRTYNLTSDRSAWTRGMLQFDGTPLAEAVALANRYSDQKIELASGAEQLRVTGAFKAGDSAGFAKGLAHAFDLKLDRTRTGGFILSRQPVSTSKKKNGG
jgi:transmembrane sensor